MATLALTLPEHISIKAATKTIVALIESTKGERVAAAALSAHGEELLETCYAGLGGAMDRYAMTHLSQGRCV